MVRLPSLVFQDLWIERSRTAMSKEKGAQKPRQPVACVGRGNSSCEVSECVVMSPARIGVMTALLRLRLELVESLLEVPQIS